MKRSNGEGTIYKRKDGRWCGAFYDEDEMPSRHFVYGKTQAEVKKRLKKMRNNPLLNIEKEHSYTLDGWVLFYLENYKRNEVKQTTYDFYMLTYRKHIKGSFIGKIKLDQLTSNHLQKFYNNKIDKGYNAKTVRHMHVLINSALNKAEQLRYVRENVNRLVALPKKTTYNATVLSAQEAAKIFRDAKNDELYPIIALTMCTGLRKGEVMGLTWNNVNFADHELYVTGSLCRVYGEPDEKGRIPCEYKIMEPKTAKSKRTIPLIKKAEEALYIQKQRQEQEKRIYSEIYDDKGLVFAECDGNFLKQRAFMDRYHAFLKKYGVTDVRFHDLRHTFASLLLESGEPPKVIQELLGHTNISTTMDIYTHITKHGKVRALESLDKLIDV